MQGIDTETRRGKAVLICDESRALVRPRSWTEIVSWLRAGGGPYAAWNLTFDAQAILKFLPRRTLEKLALTTRADGVRWIPGKVLEVEGVSIYDAMQFYGGGGLDRTAEKWLGERKIVLPANLDAMKRSGDMLPALLDPTTGAYQLTIDYCIRDAQLAGRLMRKVLASCEDAGIDASRPLSGASLARRHWAGVKLGGMPKRVQMRGWEAYRGGRIEVLSRGHFPAVTYYDIRSAYPSVMASLIAPAACRVVQNEPLRPDAEYGLFLVKWNIPAGRSSPAPCLRHGIVCYPVGSWTSWVDRATLAAATRVYGPTVAKVRRSIQWVPERDERPFESMAEMYLERARRPGASLALKLVLNGTYGLIAERPKVWRVAENLTLESRIVAGELWETHHAYGRLSHSVVAGEITGRVRARVWEETLGLDVISYMTDAVLIAGRGEPSGPIGPNLGDWGLETTGSAVVVGSGVYAIDGDDGTRIEHTRGWRGGLLRHLTRDGRKTMVKIPELRALSLAECLENGNGFASCNDLRDTVRVLDLNFDTKRKWPGRFRAGQLLRQRIDSEPWRIVG